MNVIDSKTKRENETQEICDEMREDVEDLLKSDNIAGYAIVMWDHDYATAARWNSEFSTLPPQVLSEFCKQAIQTRMNIEDTEDAFGSRML